MSQEISNRVEGIEKRLDLLEASFHQLNEQYQQLGNNIHEIHKLILLTPNSESVNRNFDSLQDDIKHVSNKISSITEAQSRRDGREQVVSVLMKTALGVLATIMTAYLIYRLGIE